MGEYYTIANKDKRQRIDPNSLGMSSKFEGLLGTPLPELLCWLIECGAPYSGRPDLRGSWVGDSIAVIGDEGPMEPYWREAVHDFADITVLAFETMVQDSSYVYLKYAYMGIVDDEGRLVRGS